MELVSAFGSLFLAVLGITLFAVGLHLNNHVLIFCAAIPWVLFIILFAIYLLKYNI